MRICASNAHGCASAKICAWPTLVYNAKVFVCGLSSPSGTIYQETKMKSKENHLWNTLMYTLGNGCWDLLMHWLLKSIWCTKLTICLGLSEIYFQTLSGLSANAGRILQTQPGTACFLPFQKSKRVKLFCDPNDSRKEEDDLCASVSCVLQTPADRSAVLLQNFCLWKTDLWLQSQIELSESVKRNRDKQRIPLRLWNTTEEEARKYKM